ncbi:MAG: MBOAT family O-acyltransferase [Sarcina sp.]|nr:MBOAT family O-acyltransferase [Sarcina sp.]
MAFFSWQFICFLIVAVTVYYLIPGRFQWIVLLISSAWYYFVGGGPRAAVFVAVTVVTTWGGACLMDSIQKKEELKALEAAAHSSPSEEGDSGPSAGKPVKLSRAQKKELKALVQKKKRLVLTLVLLLNFGILGVLKYGSFVSTNLNSLFARFHSGTQIPVVDFILPLGISFYTFQSMGYLIDVCRGKYRAERNLFRLALFTSYFPSILQGPINRYDELASQLYTPHRFDDRRFREGILRMLWGFFKKMVIAERASVIVNEVFGGFEQHRYAGFTILVAAFFYGIQLYADFAGGIDIVAGASELFGVSIRENFRQPYMSRSISEFWQRWHMSLGNWMRDYVFYPIALSKPFARMQKSLRKKIGPYFGKVFPSFLASFIVFILVGIWHGANWKYVVYGIYHATFVSTETLFEKPYADLRRFFHIRDEAAGWKLFQMVRTLFIVSIGRYCDVAPDAGTVFRLLRATFSRFNPWILFDGSLFTFGIDERNFGLLILLIILVAAVDIINERGQTVRGIVASQQLPFRWAVYLTAIAVILVFGMYGPGFDMASFIYAQF